MIENARSHLSHGAELVVPRDLLGDLAAFVLLEDDAGLKVVDQCLWREQPTNQRLQRRRAAFCRTPGHEPAAITGY